MTITATFGDGTTRNYTYIVNLVNLNDEAPEFGEPVPLDGLGAEVSEVAAVQASLLFHGVRFTANEPGTDGNRFRIDIQSSTGSNINLPSGNTFIFVFAYDNATIDSDEIVNCGTGSRNKR